MVMVDAIWLCPEHTEEFYVPHGGTCPEPGCERELVKYVRADETDWQQFAEDYLDPDPEPMRRRLRGLIEGDDSFPDRLERLEDKLADGPPE